MEHAARAALIIALVCWLPRFAYGQAQTWAETTASAVPPSSPAPAEPFVPVPFVPSAAPAPAPDAAVVYTADARRRVAACHVDRRAHVRIVFDGEGRFVRIWEDRRNDAYLAAVHFECLRRAFATVRVVRANGAETTWPLFDEAAVERAEMARASAQGRREARRARSGEYERTINDAPAPVTVTRVRVDVETH